MIDLNIIMEKLLQKRQVFHSEADFQFALAWEIKESNRDIAIRLEKCIDKMYVDIIAEYNNKVIPIELKYKTRNTSNRIINDNNEKFELKNQGAHDQARYDFIKDISRIEELIGRDRFEFGYAIMLTNDHLYWENKAKENRTTVSDSFRIHDGRILEKNKVLDWSEKASEGTKKGRSSIILKNEYTLNWNAYRTFDGNEFRYLIVKVHNSHY